jgi:ParB-like chromosome segregation protein Spo0J
MMHIETVKISTLKLDPANVNDHDEESIAAIMRSLAEFGQQKIVVVDGDGVVKAGNGVVLAAMRLCWKEIVVHQTNLSGPKLEAYAIADNKTATFSGLSKPKLAAMLAKIEVDNAAIVAVANETKDWSNLLAQASSDIGAMLDATGFTEEDRQRIAAINNVVPPKPPKPPKPDGDEVSEKYGVVVPCSSEAAQAECYNAMIALGYDARKVRS